MKVNSISGNQLDNEDEMQSYEKMEKMDFQQLLWRAIDRISSASSDDLQRNRHIATLRILLTPYFDKTAEKEMSNIDAKKQGIIADAEEQGLKIPVMTGIADATLKSLVCLMDRRGWLSEKSSMIGD